MLDMLICYNTGTDLQMSTFSPRSHTEGQNLQKKDSEGRSVCKGGGLRALFMCRAVCVLVQGTGRTQNRCISLGSNVLKDNRQPGSNVLKDV
jgi:hypothetical protein